VSPHFLDDNLVQPSSYNHVHTATVSCNINCHY